MGGDAAPQVRGSLRPGLGAAGRLAAAVLAGLTVASLLGVGPHLGPAATSGVAGATDVATRPAVRPSTPAPDLPVQAAPTFAILPATVSETATLPPTPADPLRRFRVPVLGFHRILPHPDPGSPDYELSTAQFSALLANLVGAGWRTITAQQLAWALSAGAPPPARTFVITIDDGTDDGATDALPVMQQAGVVASLYVIASRVGTPGYLSWSQLRVMRDAGMEIGNHTTTHPHLTDLSQEDAMNEILTCQVAIASQLGTRPATLAYPYGAYNETVVTAARKSGIVAAFTTAEGHYATWSDRLVVPRINVGMAWSPSKLLALLEGYVKEPTPAPTRR